MQARHTLQLLHWHGWGRALTMCQSTALPRATRTRSQRRRASGVHMQCALLHHRCVHSQPKPSLPSLRAMPATVQLAVDAWTRALASNGVPEPHDSACYLMAATLVHSDSHQLPHSRPSPQQRAVQAAALAAHWSQPSPHTLCTWPPPAGLEANLDTLEKHAHLPLLPSQWRSFSALCTRRAVHRLPIQYLVGEWDFHCINLALRPPVLIPRPETELLVDHAAAHIQNTANATFVDVGCGSGAITLALLASIPHARAVAIDVSADACHLTHVNAIRLGLRDRVHIFHGTLRDYLEAAAAGPHQGGAPSGISLWPLNLDLLVSNPPYIPDADAAQLEPEVAHHEDKGALFGGGADGMGVINSIMEDATSRVEGTPLLKPGAPMWLEVDPSQIHILKTRFSANRSRQHHHSHTDSPTIEFLNSHRDLSGRARFAELVLR